MRKVTEKVISAWERGESCSVGNTMTDGVTVWLHGHAIIKRDDAGMTFVRSAGYRTKTTKERLNAVTDVVQRKGEWYLNGRLWSNHEDWSLAEVIPDGCLAVWADELCLK